MAGRKPRGADCRAQVPDWAVWAVGPSRPLLAGPPGMPQRAVLSLAGQDHESQQGLEMQLESESLLAGVWTSLPTGSFPCTSLCP